MKSVCTSFLKAALRDTIVKLIESKQSCELNPTKMDSPEDACSNAEFLLQVFRSVCTYFYIQIVQLVILYMILALGTGRSYIEYLYKPRCLSKNSKIYLRMLTKSSCFEMAT